MEIKNSKRWAKAGWEPYYMGLLGMFLAFAVRYTLQPLLDDHLSMFFFAINCIVIAFLYGLLPTLAILAPSMLVSTYFFVKPFNTLDWPSETDFFVIVVYGTIISSTALLFELLRREKYKSDLHARVSDCRYRMLVEADEERRASIRRIAE